MNSNGRSSLVNYYPVKRRSHDNNATDSEVVTATTTAPLVTNFHHNPELTNARRVNIENERLKSQLTFERGRFEKNLASRDERIIELEKDRSFLLQSEAQLRSSLEDAQRKAQVDYFSLQKQLAMEKKKVGELSERMIDVESERRRVVRELENLKSEMVSLQGRIEKDQLTFSIQLANKDQRIHDLEAKLRQDCFKVQPNLSGNIVISNSSNSHDDDDDAASSKRQRRDSSLADYKVLEKIHRLEVSNRKLKHENEVLRESTCGLRLVEEKLYSAEQRLEKYNSLEREHFRLLAQITELKNSESSTPSQLVTSKDICELLERTAKLTDLQMRFGQLEANYVATCAELEPCKAKLESTQVELKRLSSESTKLYNSLLFSQQQEAIRKAEIEILRAQLDAAEKMEKTSQSVILGLGRRLKPDS